MTAKLEFVPIDQLAAFVDKKATVDIMGIVTAVAPLGSIKRKTDSTEISRRDITLVDQGLKTVTLTLWGGAAENAGAELEALATTNPVVAISACRVSSYNGVSVSALSRSQVLIQPVDAYVEKTQALQAWWQSEGCHAQLNPVGEGLPSAMKNGVNGGGPKPRVELETVRAEAPEKPEDKAVYSTVAAAVASISPDQSMWYLACPENNRKVSLFLFSKFGVSYALLPECASRCTRLWPCFGVVVVAFL
jgi:replication factor A1